MTKLINKPPRQVLTCPGCKVSLVYIEKISENKFSVVCSKCWSELLFDEFELRPRNG